MRKIMYALSVVFVFTVLSRVFGFLREIVMANYLGADKFADQVIFLYTIPLYLQMIIGGAFTTAFISIGIKEESDEGSVYFSIRRLLNITTTFLIIFLMVINVKEFTSIEIILAYFFSFSTMFFYNQYSLMSGKFNIEKKYLSPLIAILINNIIGIILIVFFNIVYQTQYMITYALSFFISSIVAWGYLKYSFSLEKYLQGPQKSSEKFTKRILYFAFPIVLGGAIPQILNLIQRLQLNFLNEPSNEGTLAMFNYASKIITLPQSIIVSIISTMLFPRIVRGLENDNNLIVKEYKKFEWMLVLIMGVFSMFLIFSGDFITQILFYFGDFDYEQKNKIAKIIRMLSFLSVSLVLIVFSTRYFYALEMNKVSVSISFIFTVLMNNLIFIILSHFSFDILFAVTLSSYASTILNYLALRFIFMKRMREGEKN